MAVRVSSRYDGYSWSGAANDQDETPLTVCSTCAWQLDGQCCRVSRQDSADAGSTPSCWSVACPVTVICCPTTQRSVAAGESITGSGSSCGGWSMVTVTVAVPVAPAPSRTCSPTGTDAAAV